MPVWHGESLTLAGFDEASCHIVSCSMKRPTGQEWEGKTEASVQQPHEELSPANNHMSGPGR